MFNESKLERKNYAFLQTVIKTDDEDVYNVLLISEDFLDLVSVNVTYKDLKIISSKDLVCNFLAEDDYLRGEGFAVIRRNTASIELLDEEVEQTFSFSEGENIFSLIHYCLDTGILVDENLCKEDEDGTYLFGVHGTCRFSNIKFSESTMSMYYHVLESDGLSNRTLVYLDSDTKMICVRGFSFIMPKGEFALKSQYFKKVGDAIYNELDYELFRCEFQPVYTPGVLLTCGDAINLGCCLKVYYESYLNVLNVILNSIENKEQETLPWVGSKDSRKSIYGVLFESSAKKITPSCAQDTFNYVMKSYVIPAKQSGKSADEVVNEVCSLYTQNPVRNAYALIINLMLSSPDRVQVWENTLEQKRSLGKLYVKIGLYLYYVRCNVYLKQIGLVDRMDPVLHSCFMNETTFVEEGLYYGQI